MSLPFFCHPFFGVLCHLLSSRRYASGLDWGLRPCAPFSPGAVVNADVGIPQEIPQDQRCLARPDTYGTVGDDAALGDHSAVLKKLTHLSLVLEGPVRCPQTVARQHPVTA